MEFFKKYKKILISVVVFAIALFVYMTFFSSPSDDSALVASSTVASETAIEIDLITLLLELNNVELDGELFERESFQFLVDFGQEILPEPVGRPNPFAPIEREDDDDDDQGEMFGGNVF